MDVASALPERVATVDPRAPRFGQGITASLLLVGVALSDPRPVYLVAVLLGIPVVGRWRVDPYRTAWTTVGVRALGRSETREPAAPHRFAKLIGAGGTGLAALLLLLGVSTAGFAVAAAVAGLAGLAATTGLCVGCRMYHEVSTLRRVDVI